MSVNEVKRWVDEDDIAVVAATDYDAAMDGQRQMSRDIKFYRELSERLQKDVYFWKSRYNEKCQKMLEVNDLRDAMDAMNLSGVKDAR